MNLVIYFIAILSCIMAGMGIGGGGIFILLCNIFNLIMYKEAMCYNLIMFVVSGISASYSNYKNKLIDKNLFKKLIIPVCFGSIVGSVISKNINENILKNFFCVFMLLFGLYEIISSLKNIIKTKNNNV